ncbi:helix-turn-helix transcriptional regulator [Brevibacterium album]|uniref:helix-turn-helix transcriptional regulator n=1 Tax=Brevibacterium album TaxID=417948 RepID=UPI0004261ACC|nr:WYL domain-containing protein [Brevibacterium album]
MSRVRRQTERLLNLLIALRAAQGWVDREFLRRAIQDYADLDDAAFDRQFSRDKQALAELGIRISVSDWDDPVTGGTGYGYRIEDSDYALTEIGFTPEEAALVSVSRTLLDDTAFAAGAGTALSKLRGLGDGFDAGSGDSTAAEVSARLPGSLAGTAFADLLHALEARRAVSFDYRRPGGESATRRLEPYALLTRGARSYVMGRDLDRGAVRSFRLSRISGRIAKVPRRRDGDYAIPEDFRAAEQFAPEPAAEPAEMPVRCLLALAPGRALPLREEGAPAVLPAEAAAPAGWEGCEVPLDDPARFAERLLEFTPSVAVVAPASLRGLHRELLAATAQALEVAGRG